jgi:formamidopyrimidine-DNA glycosylase
VPELPEVETIRNILKEFLMGKTIIGSKFSFTGMLGGLSAETFAEDVHGNEIQDIKRRGKYLFFYLSNEKVLEIHLRMTGAFFYYPAESAAAAAAPTPSVTAAAATAAADRHIRAVFYLNDGSELHFRDIRKFATFRLRETGELDGINAARLGPDLLDDFHDQDSDSFREILKKKPRSSLKAFLLEQRNVAGLGNIYTDEALFRAGLNPARRLETLSSEEEASLLRAIRDVLREGIAYGGVSVSDYQNPYGQRGEFQLHLRVYRRENEPCTICQGLIVRTAIAGRGTYFCPACQVM